MAVLLRPLHRFRRASWLRLLLPIAVAVFLFALGLFGLPLAALAEDNPVPTAQVGGHSVPDWNKITFSSLPAFSSGGSVSVPPSLVDQLGYDPSVDWHAGDTPADVLKLGSLQDLGVDQMSLGQTADLGGADLSQTKLSDSSLLNQQTFGSLVQANPALAKLKLSQVKPLNDLIQSKFQGAGDGSAAFEQLKNSSIGDLASDQQYSDLPLDQIDLSKYSFTSIPEIENTKIGDLQGWQNTTVSQAPGVANIELSQFTSSLGALGFLAQHDVTYGPKEHRFTPTRRSITGSNKVGFNYQCVQSKGCSYLELNSPFSLGALGDLIGLHGAQWIKGGTSPGGQMVPGGEGVLGALNNGMEPTGRLPYGSTFKVVLTNTIESKGEGDFGLFFRYCHHGVPELGCTPYFIGPVPWFPTHEKDFVIVGLTMDLSPPSGIQSPPPPQSVQDVLDQYGGNDSSSGDGNGVGYGSDCGSKLANAAPSGDRPYAGKTVPLLLNAAKKYGVTDKGQIAYILATTQAEVDFNPRNENDSYSQSGACGNYCGRGDVQLTNPNNYARAGHIIGVDLTNHPELANDPNNAAQIAVLGMQHGWFTGASLGNFIHGSNQDFVNARTIVNGHDRDQEIAGYAQNYYKVLQTCTASAPTSTGGGSSGNGQPGALQPNYVSPNPGCTVTSGYGPRIDPWGASEYHPGVDCSTGQESPIHSVNGGKVVATESSCPPNLTGANDHCGQGYGNYVVVAQSDGYQIMYSHLSHVNVQNGQDLSQGQNLGQEGTSGRSTGNHLLFEVDQVNSGVDPYSGWLSPGQYHTVDPASLHIPLK